MDDFEFIDDIRFKILRKEQEKLAEKFIKSGEACLYCESDNVTEDDLDDVEAGVRQTVFRCDDCGKAWTGYYGLIGIETDELREKGDELIPEPE